MTDSDARQESAVGQYVDVREVHPTWQWEECWNCDNRRLVRQDRPPWRVCKECFMGQEKVDEEHRTSCTTEDGYDDYRLLWYGDVSIEEAKRRYEQTAEEIRTRHSIHADKREVRI